MRAVIYSMVAITLLAAATALAVWLGSRIPAAHTLTVTRLYSVPPEKLWRLVKDRAQWRDMTVETEEQDRPERLVLRMRDRKNQFSARWELDFEPLGGGTQLQITETGQVTNPIVRLLQHSTGRDAFVISFMDGLANVVRA
ncbi:MAG: hypothetical protein ACI9WU_000942 [Myxococcota bacterium]